MPAEAPFPRSWGWSEGTAGSHSLSPLRLDSVRGGGKGAWSREALEFPILGLPDLEQPPLFVLLALGEGTGLSRPPRSARDRLLSREGCFASFLSF